MFDYVVEQYCINQKRLNNVGRRKCMCIFVYLHICIFVLYVLLGVCMRKICTVGLNYKQALAGCPTLLSVFTSLNTIQYIFICLCVIRRVYTYVCAYIHTYAPIYICMRVYTYVCAYIHTYARTLVLVLSVSIIAGKSEVLHRLLARLC